MAYKMIIADLDGTLLTTEKQLSTRTVSALEKAAAKGVFIVPATGRFLAGLPDAVRSLPFLQYVIAINGAEIHDVKNSILLHSDSILPQQAASIFDYLDTIPVIYDCYQNNKAPMDARFYEQIDTYISDPHIADLIKNTRTPVQNFRQTMFDEKEPIQKIQLFFKDEDMVLRENILAALPKLFPYTSVTSSLKNNIEINATNANKGHALQILCDELEIDIVDAIAFGDGGNDVSMLQVAGLGIAMENACNAAKAAANVTTDSNDEDGVAKAIERYIL